MATDASRSRSYTGGGFVCRDGVYDFWQYGSRAARKLIDFLEGDTVVETVRRMARRWKGCMVKFYIDNMVFEKSGRALAVCRNKCSSAVHARVQSSELLRAYKTANRLS